MKKYWRNHKFLVVLAAVMITITSAIQVSFEYFKGAILDAALEKSLQNLIFMAASFIIAVLLKALTHYFYTFTFGKFKSAAMFDIRNNIFKKILFQSFPSFLKRKRGEYVSVYSNELNIIDMSYFQSFYGISQIIMEALFSIITLFLINKYLCLIAIVILFPPIFIPQLLKKRISDVQKKYMNSTRQHTSKIREWIQSFEIIENYEAIPQFLDRHNDDNKILLSESKRLQTLSVATFNISKILMELNLVIIIAICIFLLFKGYITAGLFVTAIGVMAHLQSQIVYIAMYIKQFIIANATIKNINEFVATNENEESRTQALNAVENIEFQSVYFKYSKEAQKNIISNFNLKVYKPGIYVIQGESGCGKSTLMNLLMNYYEPTEGLIKINSASVNSIKNLQEKITVMRQEAVFFDDSLRNNLTAYDQTISDEKIIEYLNQVGLEKYAMKNALDKTINYKADEFSGGQAARFSLCRSMLRNTDILILDEPFASVDEETINKISSSIIKETEKVIFLITHLLPKNLEKHSQKIIKLN